MIAYKLLNRDLTTYNQTQWVVGETKRTDGHGGLCGPGWLHAYTHPELAYFLDQIHARFTDPVLYEVEVGGSRLDDGPLKSGWTEMTLIRPSPCPIPTIEQRVRFAIRCSLAVYHEPSYRTWAMNWITSQNRSRVAANAAAKAAGNAAAYAAVYTAYAAVHAAVDVAAYAAVYTAYAAVYAAVDVAMHPAMGTLDLHACAVWAYSDSLDLDEVL